MISAVTKTRSRPEPEIPSLYRFAELKHGQNSQPDGKTGTGNTLPDDQNSLARLPDGQTVRPDQQKNRKTASLFQTEPETVQDHIQAYKTSPDKQKRL